MSGADFLSGEQSEPLSGEAQEFLNDKGFIGQCKATRLWQLSSVYGPGDKDLPVPPTAYEIRGSWNWMWWREKDDALLAHEALETEFKPKAVWRYEMRTDSIVNIPEESLAKFEREYQSETCHTSMYSFYRHEMHLMSMVGAVAAYAKLLGYSVPKPNFDDLVSSNVQFTDQLMHTLIGDPALNGSEVDEPLHYLKSVYGKQRAGIWAALGESDPSKYNATYDEKGNPTLEAPNITFTESEKLAKVLGIIHLLWNKKVWTRLLFLPDPRVDAIRNDFRNRIPVIMEFFPDKATAVRAGKAELAKRTERTGDTVTIELAIPVAWAEDPASWSAELAEIETMLDGTKAKPARRKKVENYIVENYESEEEFGATVEDVLAHL